MYNLSIVVPIYNVEQYLEKCIESILNQTFKDFELILVDDGSPDRCGEICDKYKQIDNRIKVIHKENGGLSSARNAGIDIATGEYIGFVDSDDWINKKMFEKLLILAERNNADIVQCKYRQVIDEKIDYASSDSMSYKTIDSRKALENLVKFGVNHVYTVVAWNKIYKRKLFDGIRYPVGKIHEDEFTTYKLLSKADKIILLDSELYYYRQTPNSIMNKNFNLKRLDLLDAIKELLCFLDDSSYKDIYEMALLRYEVLLKQFYYKCEDFMSDRKEVLEKIRLSYKEYADKFIKNTRISMKERLIVDIFNTSPKIYKFIQQSRKKSLY